MGAPYFGLYEVHFKKCPYEDNLKSLEDDIGTCRGTLQGLQRHAVL